MNNTKTKSPPPSFAAAKNPRQKARASGMDPDRWYVVEYDKYLCKINLTIKKSLRCKIFQY